MFLEREGLRGRARALIPADPKIYAHLPYVIDLDDEVVRTRDNGLMISLEVTGIDGITSGSSAITAAMCRGTAQIAARVGAASVHRAEAWPARSGMWLQKLGAAMALVLSGAAVAQSPPTPADCDRPVYLAFETGSMRWRRWWR